MIDLTKQATPKRVRNILNDNNKKRFTMKGEKKDHEMVHDEKKRQ